MSNGTGTALPHAARPGDWLTVARLDGSAPRRGQILEVLGAGGHVHFHVRWDEEHESLFYPDERVTIARDGPEPGEEDAR